MERVNKKSVKVSSLVDLPDEILLLLTFTHNILIVGVKFQGTFKDHLRTAECPKDSANIQYVVVSSLCLLKQVTAMSLVISTSGKQCHKLFKC